MQTSEKIRCLVTGGSGFVGRRLVKELVAAGTYHVIVLDLNSASKDDAFPESVIFVPGDITEPNNISQVMSGAKIVFHVAAAAPTAANSLSKELMQRVNVDGTKHVIDACRQCGVEKLIYTSSASVAHDGSDILYKNEEELGYASRQLDHYTGTKATAEKMVLEANGKGLATCALRPSAVFGEGDTLMVPSFVNRAKEGKMKYIIGNGENVMDFTYVGNVAQAHLLAAEKLSLDSPVAGQAYFITNQEPWRFWEFAGDILEGLGYERPRIKIPALLILIIVFIFQIFILPIIRPLLKKLPDLTTTRIKFVSRNRAFNPKKSIEQLEYIPKVSMSEALKKTIQSFKHLKNETKKDA